MYADKRIGADVEALLFERLGMPRSTGPEAVSRAPAYMVRGGQTLRILSDNVGSPRLVVNVSNGSVVQRTDYDEWGAVTNSTGTRVQPFGFAGGLYDEDTGLVHFGARDYDPVTGRWLSKDPVKTTGVLNLYEYASGDPINGADPSGLAPLSAQEKREILDTICGPGVQGEVVCVERVLENQVSAQGANVVAPTDTTAQIGLTTELPQLAPSGDTTTESGEYVGAGELPATVNAAPTVSAGSNLTVTLPTGNVALSGSVTDDGRPAGYGLAILWYTKSGPLEAAIANPNAAQTTASFSAPGAYLLELRASDGEYTVASTMTVTVLPPTSGPNAAPVVNATGPAEIDLAFGGSVQATAYDDGLPTGSTLTTSWNKVSGPGDVDFSAPSALATDVQFSEPGVYVIGFAASDTELTSTATLTINVVRVNHAPEVQAGADQQIDPPTMVVSLVGSATDDGLPTGATLAYAWSLASGPSGVSFGAPEQPSTTAQFSYPGTYVLRLSVSDSEKIGADELTVTVGAPAGNKPAVAFAGLGDDQTITRPTQVLGTVSEGAWVLDYRLGGRDDVEGEWKVLGSGAGAVSGGVLGTVDPTLLLNGLYTLRLSSKTSGGESVEVASAVVDGRMKVGNFTLSFTDLEVPMPGLPVQVVRTYDSRDGLGADFGYRWKLDVKNLRVEKSGKTGAYWVQTKDDSGLFPQYCVDPTKSTTVTITMPGGRVYRFAAKSSPHCQTLFPLNTPDIEFECVSDPGNDTIKLTANGAHNVFLEGPIPGHSQLLDSEYKVWDPRQFTLTTEDGTVYDIDQDRGAVKVTDRVGNTLEVRNDGVVHSSGKSVAFERDTQGRITRVVDPAGEALRYEYDAKGDLVAQVDREQNRTTFAYAGNHYLQDIYDPLGRRPIRNEYDASGRLTKHVDAIGHEIVYSHDVANKTELVTDRLGNATQYEYNELGDVVRKTDALGKAWNYTYDGRGNKLTETDPLGHTTTYTYDSADNELSRTDALGHESTQTYNKYKQLLVSTDALGHTTTNLYDFRFGTLTSTTDAAGNVTSYTYDAKGNRLTTTDAQGHLSRWEYDSDGNVTKEVDALGRETTRTYDANNRKLSETRTRGGVSEVTSWTYDKNGHTTRVQYPDGASTQTEWTASGKRHASVDELGRRTEYAYNQLDQLETTTYADLTTTTQTYDWEGHVLTRTDQGGKTTQYEYDALGRVKKTTNPDTSTTQTGYDDAGRVVSQTNENGHSSTTLYDNAGRRIASIDALGNGTTYIYDVAGQQTDVIDALGHGTHSTLDALGRVTQTTFADGSSVQTSYDSLGRMLTKTDELGRVTTFGYDALGRLTSVLDAKNGLTQYTYDEVGNRLTQTDANGHTTSFEYDSRGRETKRTLPDGAYETKGYSAAGRMTTRVDFLGRTTVYGYDLLGRMTSRTYPDTSSVSFTYTATGRRATATDARGTTTYQYDDRNRVSHLIYPDGRTLDYGYNAAGARTSLTAHVGGETLTTTYTYDVAERPDQVRDPLARVYDVDFDAAGRRTYFAYPNGTMTSYGYDLRNRVTSIQTLGVQSYSFTLDAAGNRTQIVEGDGTTRAYGYDELGRLTSETVTGPTNYNRAFTYDAVGNRTALAGSDGSKVYAYDSRDRLLAENSTTYGYDANGNLTSKSGEATYTWDFENRLIRVDTNGGTVVEHVYDVDGNRVRTTVAGVPTNFLVDTCGGGSCSGSLSHVVAETDGLNALTALYVRLGDELLAVMRPGGVTRWVHHDGIGSVRVLTDEAGVTTDTRAYEAYGVEYSRAGTDAMPYGFAGEAFEGTSQLAYHRARWMDPRVGRFAGVDPVRGELRTPATLWPYSYGNDNPVIVVDPNGQMGVAMAMALTVGIGIFASLAVASHNGLRGGAALGVHTGVVDTKTVANPLPLSVQEYLAHFFVGEWIDFCSINVQFVSSLPLFDADNNKVAENTGLYNWDMTPKGVATIWLNGSTPGMEGWGSSAQVAYAAHEIEHVAQHLRLGSAAKSKYEEFDKRLGYSLNPMEMAAFEKQYTVFNSHSWSKLNGFCPTCY